MRLMNNDSTRCTNDECPRRGQCVRWLLFEGDRLDPLPPGDDGWQVRMYVHGEWRTGEGCALYWATDEGYNHGA